MNFRTTVILLAVLALVIAAVLAIEFWPAADAPQSEETVNRLFSADQVPFDHLQHVVLRDSTRTIRLEAGPDGWWQIEPVRFPVQAQAIRPILFAIGALDYVRAFTPGEDDEPTLADTGLDKPAVTLTLEFTPGIREPLQLKLGRTIRGGRAFLRIGDNPQVHLVDDQLHQFLLQADPQAWRERDLSRFDLPRAASAASLNIHTPDQPIRLHQAGDTWWMTQPQRDRAAPSAIDRLLTTIKGLPITAFLSDDPAQWQTLGLQQPRYRFTIARPVLDVDQPDRIRRFDLRLGAAVTHQGSEHLYAAWTVTDTTTGLFEQDPPLGAGTVVFLVNQLSVDYLLPRLGDLRDPRLTILDPQIADTIALTAGAAPAYTLRREAAWKFAEPAPDYPADHDLARQFIESILATRAVAFSDTPQPTTSPARIVEVRDLETDRSDTLRFHEAPEAVAPTQHGQDLPIPLPMPFTDEDEPDDQPRHWLCYRNDETIARVVRHLDVETLFQSPLMLRSRQLTLADWSSIQQITIAIPGVITHRFIRRQPDLTNPAPWQLDGFDSFERLALSILQDEIAPVDVVRWFAEPAETAPDWLRLRITTADTETTLAIDPETRRATLEGAPHSFEVTPDLLAALRQEFRAVTLIPAAPTEVARVEVIDTSLSPKPIVLRREGFHARATDLPADRRLDQDAAVALIAALAPLQVETFLDPVEAPTAKRTLILSTTAGRTYRVELLDTDNPPRVATINRTTVRLSPDVWSALTTDLLRQP